MNQRNASMTVIGAGSYGTALAITLARNGHEVVLWGHDPEPVSYTHLTLPTSNTLCRSRWSPYH